MAVVDHTLKLGGVNGLRAADASVMSTILSSNTNVPFIPDRRTQRTFCAARSRGRPRVAGRGTAVMRGFAP
jgi:hypothetical protein